MERFHAIDAVILAAGNSSRFGETPKQLAKFNGNFLLDIIIDIAIHAGFPRPILILGANEKEIQATCKRVEQCEVIINSAWREGLASSIRSAISAMKTDCVGAVFLLADQPLLPPALLTEMSQLFIREKPDLLCPEYQGKRGNPTIISSRLFPELLRHTGDSGGRFLFAREDLTIIRFPVPHQSCLLDIDTPEDLEHVRATD